MLHFPLPCFCSLPTSVVRPSHQSASDCTSNYIVRLLQMKKKGIYKINKASLGFTWILLVLILSFRRVRQQMWHILHAQFAQPHLWTWLKQQGNPLLSYKHHFQMFSHHSGDSMIHLLAQQDLMLLCIPYLFGCSCGDFVYWWVDWIWQASGWD